MLEVEFILELRLELLIGIDSALLADLIFRAAIILGAASFLRSLKFWPALLLIYLLMSILLRLFRSFCLGAASDYGWVLSERILMLLFF